MREQHIGFTMVITVPVLRSDIPCMLHLISDR